MHFHGIFLSHHFLWCKLNFSFFKEKLVDNICDNNSEGNVIFTNYSNLLLLTGVKVFLKSPAEAQHILGRIFQLCEKTHRNKVIFYVNLLRQHASLCRQQILSINDN